MGVTFKGLPVPPIYARWLFGRRLTVAAIRFALLAGAVSGALVLFHRPAWQVLLACAPFAGPLIVAFVRWAVWDAPWYYVVTCDGVYLLREEEPVPSVHSRRARQSARWLNWAEPILGRFCWCRAAVRATAETWCVDYGHWRGLPALRVSRAARPESEAPEIGGTAQEIGEEFLIVYERKDAHEVAAKVILRLERQLWDVEDVFPRREHRLFHQG